MLDIGYFELAMIAVVALIAIGPKDLPKAMRAVGQWVGRAKAMSRHLRAGMDEMVRQAELEELEKEWREHNAKIMAATPTAADFETKPTESPAREPDPPTAAERPLP